MRTCMAEFSKRAAPTDGVSIAAHFQRPQLMMGVVSILTFIVYSVSLSFPFVWDDEFQIVNFPLIHSWSNLPRIFGSRLWIDLNHGQLYYRPLFNTWNVLNYSLFQLNPMGWHILQVLVYIVAIWAVYDLGRKLGLRYWMTATATLLFALHPIHIESVSWISAVSEDLVTVFYLLAFSSFLRSREPEQERKFFWRVISIVLLACAFLTKEIALSFPVLAGFYAWLFPSQEGKRFKNKAKEACVAAFPYFLITLLYLILRHLAMGAVIAGGEARPTFGEFLLTVSYVLAFYLRKLLVPFGLTALYYTPYESSSRTDLFVVSVLLLSAYAAVARFAYRKSGDKTIVFLALWPLVTLGPALYLPALQNGDFVRDRYVFLPSAGFALLLAQYIFLLPGIPRLKLIAVRGMVVGALVLAYLIGDSQQAFWASDHAIFERGYRLYPENLYAKIGLARVLQREGKPDQSVQLLTEAIQQDPSHVEAYWQLAEAYSRLGKKAEGLKALSDAEQISEKSKMGGAMDVADLAGIYGRLGAYEQAQGLCDRALEASPDLFSGLYNCGVIDFQMGKYGQAEQLLEQAEKQSPGVPAAVYWLGRVHMAMGKGAQSQQEFTVAISLAADVAEYHFWLAQALEKTGDVEHALREYNEALRLDPKQSLAKLRLQQLRDGPRAASAVSGH